MSIVEVISLETPPSMATEGFEVTQVDKGGPAGTVKTEGGRKNAQWTLADDRLMLELLTEEQRRGRRADNGFKRGTWASVAAEVNKIRSKGGEKDEKSAKFRFNKVHRSQRRYRIARTDVRLPTTYSSRTTGGSLGTRC